MEECSNSEVASTQDLWSAPYDPRGSPGSGESAAASSPTARRSGASSGRPGSGEWAPPASISTRSRGVCFAFRDRGTCQFGDQCRYEHVSVPGLLPKSRSEKPKAGPSATVVPVPRVRNRVRLVSRSREPPVRLRSRGGRGTEAGDADDDEPLDGEEVSVDFVE